MAQPDSTSRSRTKRRGITERRRADGTTAYMASAYDRVSGKRIYETFPTLSAAEKWRRDQQVAIASGKTRAVESVAFGEAWSQWLKLAKAGTVRTRSGGHYKPSVIRGYVTSYEVVWLKHFEVARVGDIRLGHVQRVVDELTPKMAAQTVRNHVTALRVLFKWAIRQELAITNPCTGLALPAGEERRDRIATPAEAAALIAALPDVRDQALWGCAFYAGLRRGELQALARDSIDLAAGAIRVERSWDQIEGIVPPKSKAGVRTVPIPGALRPLLSKALLACQWREGLLFGRRPDLAFLPRTIERRTHKACMSADLHGMGLHEARHTYASLLIAAGVNLKTIQTYMGHSSITTTLDRYGHLLPGAADEAVDLLDSYLSRAA